MQRANSQTSTSTSLYTNPPNLDHWVERKDEIEIIKAWLDNPQVTTMGITQANTLGIQGLGGVGKSTLAAYVYHFLDFEAKFWADVSLKPDFTVFAEQAIRALGGKVFYPIDVTQLINNLLQLLSQYRCLLVIDNLETLLDEDRNWQDKNYQKFFNCWQQQGINSTLLITTQDKPKSFQGIQQWYPLGGMKTEEGISLLNKFAIKGTPEELETFVRYVDGHPLTIKLVAGYLIEYCDSKLSQVTELGLEEFDLAYMEAEGSHRNKQDARLSWIIQQHINRLNPIQQEFLTNLSVYRLPFNREAASYMWIEQGVKTFVIQKKLQELCNRSLLTKTKDNKFQFESLVQKYIVQQASNFTNAHEKAIKYYRANLKPKDSFSVLADTTEHIEISNHYCEIKEYAKAKSNLDNCLEFLFSRGFYLILAEEYEKLAQAWESDVLLIDISDYAISLNSLATIYLCLGKTDESIKFHENAINILKKTNNLKDKYYSKLCLGNTYISCGQYSKSFKLIQESLRGSEEIHNLWLKANSLMAIGNYYVVTGEYHKAIEYNHRSLIISKKIDDSDNIVASVLNSIASAYYYLGEYQMSIDFYTQSLDIATKVNNPVIRSQSFVGLGNVCVIKGDYSKAIEYYQRISIVSLQVDNPRIKASYFGNLGIIYSLKGEYNKAAKFYKKALKIFREVKDFREEQNTLNNLANVYYSLGQYQQAINDHQESLHISEKIGDMRGIACSLSGLGTAYFSLEQYNIAANYFLEALEIQESIKDLKGVTLSLNNLGNIYFELKEYQYSIYFYEKSLNLAQKNEFLYAAALSTGNLGNAYYSLGEYQKSINFHKKSLEIKQKINLTSGEVDSLVSLGLSFHGLREHKKAIDCYQKAQQIANNIGYINGEARACFNIGNAWKILKQKSRALMAYKNAKFLCQEMKLEQRVKDCDHAIQELENIE